jgi:hypothetical protein
VILFPFFIIVIPDIPSLPSWLNLSRYPSPVTFPDLKSNPNQPSLSTQRTSTTSTSSSSSPSGTAGDWFISTWTNATEAQSDDLLDLLSKHGLNPYNTQSGPALGYEQFEVTMNSSMASQIRQHPAVQVLFEIL